MIRILIGFDPREAVAYNVLQFSIQRRASVPVMIAPLMLSQLTPVLKRERHPLQSTDFSFTRFLTPWLSDFSGWSLFLDCDMLILEDIQSLWSLRDDKYSIMVVKHSHKPRESTKFLGEAQSAYEKKNWSSVMLFNNARCRRLTPEYVSGASGLDLHQFKWLDGDELIGELPNQWNHLVGYDLPKAKVSLVHYTLGGPYFTSFADCEYSDEWRRERDAMNYSADATA